MAWTDLDQVVEQMQWEEREKAEGKNLTETPFSQRDSWHRICYLWLRYGGKKGRREIEASEGY